ncbi:MAG: hydrogenase 4 subunit B [Deltaproteobacteria bacterium]|nr:hydrogenase 4 subunit B [Deltaproteobacteria bacterium]
MDGALGLGALVCFNAVGAAAALLSSRSSRWALQLGHLGALGSGLIGAFLSGSALVGSTPLPIHVDLPPLIPFARMSLHLDGLGAFFLLVISVITISASIYGPSYFEAHSKHEARKGSAAIHVLGLNVFTSSMALLVCAGDALSFLLLWEGMTLASYVLVVSDTTKAENTRAGLLYIVMAHAGTALLMAAFLTLTDRANGFEFTDLRNAARSLDEDQRSFIFFLAFTGFAAKAGLVPLHVWLPYAHPAAPSHISALMSGVMLKVAIYGMLRFGFDLVPPTGAFPAAWGWTAIVLGTVSALVGVLYALQQQDLKRLLAFSSVENVGIILIGVGSAMLLKDWGGRFEPLATVALAAALLHTLSHAAFKGLLFLGTGAVLSATNTSNMEQLGGLARRMPWTAGLFLVGAIAICALPPLSGFVSEWLTFQALVLGGARMGGASGLLTVVTASMLALAGGLATTCFVKAFGITFLGRPRTEAATHAVESAPPMLVAMVLLALATAAIGLLPGFALTLLDAPTSVLIAGPSPSELMILHGPLVLSAPSAALPATSISTTLVAVLLLVLSGAAAMVAFWPRVAPTRRAPTWTCGVSPVARFDYTATAFAKPLRLIFATLYRPRRQIVRETGPNPYELERVRFEGEVVDLAEMTIYIKGEAAIVAFSHAIRARSTGRIHSYIGFVLVTLLVTLLLFGSD